MLDPLSKPASAKVAKTSRQPMLRARRSGTKSRSNGQGSTSLKSFNASTSDELLLTAEMTLEADLESKLAFRKQCRLSGYVQPYRRRG